MEVRTITCHDVYNHGATLQALALVTYLNRTGHNARIIDYKPDYSNTYHNLGKVANPAFDKFGLRHIYLALKFPSRMYSIMFRAKPFDRFREKFLPLTEHYSTHEELIANPPVADAYIAGSDQIWNTMLPNGRDGAFYLDFAPKGKRKIAYAASFSITEIGEDIRPSVIENLKNFDNIALRERSSLPLLESLGREDGVAVCDPVFLLSKEEWISLLGLEELKEKGISGYPSSIDKLAKEKYLLVYDTEKSSSLLKDVALKIAEKKNLGIVSIGSFKQKYADVNLWHPAPYDFVKMIAGAEYVVSNSFHASAFSMIFEKNFCVVKRSEKINSRMQSLTQDYKIGGRLVDKYSKNLLEYIDYSDIREAMKKETDFSKAFLKEALKTVGAI